jgi:hypothetical protein
MKTPKACFLMYIINLEFIFWGKCQKYPENIMTLYRIISNIYNQTCFRSNTMDEIHRRKPLLDINAIKMND